MACRHCQPQAQPCVTCAVHYAAPCVQGWLSTCHCPLVTLQDRPACFQEICPQVQVWTSGLLSKDKAELSGG